MQGQSLLSSHAVHQMDADTHNKDLLREVGDEAVWTLSSAKPGNGVDQLRDNLMDTFWQSDGPQPHYITIQFHRRMEISELAICSIFKSDESYTPAQLSIRIGSGPHDMQEIQVVDLKEPEGWVRVPLCSYSEPSMNVKKCSNVSFKYKDYNGAIDSVRTYAVQIVILSNHQNGRDTHLRQVKVYSPRHDLEFSSLPIPNFCLKTPQCIEFTTNSIIR